MEYMGWYDDNPKKPAADKIADAVRAYVARFQTQPNACLVSEKDAVTIEGMTIRTAQYVRPNIFLIGRDESHKSDAPGHAGAVQTHDFSPNNTAIAI